MEGVIVLCLLLLLLAINFNLFCVSLFLILSRSYLHHTCIKYLHYPKFWTSSSSNKQQQGKKNKREKHETFQICQQNVSSCKDKNVNMDVQTNPPLTFQLSWPENSLYIPCHPKAELRSFIYLNRKQLVPSHLISSHHLYLKNQIVCPRRNMEGLIPFLIHAMKKQRPQNSYRCLSENSTTTRSYHLLLGGSDSVEGSSHRRTRSDFQPRSTVDFSSEANRLPHVKSFSGRAPAVARLDVDCGLQQGRFTSAEHHHVSGRPSKWRRWRKNRKMTISKRWSFNYEVWWIV